MATAAVLFFFVLLRFSAAFRQSGRVPWTMAGGGIVVALAPPVAGLAGAGAPLVEFPADDYRALMYGSALWVTLALALAAYGMSRLHAAETS